MKYRAALQNTIHNYMCTQTQTVGHAASQHCPVFLNEGCIKLLNE